VCGPARERSDWPVSRSAGGGPQGTRRLNFNERSATTALPKDGAGALGSLAGRLFALDPNPVAHDRSSCARMTQSRDAPSFIARGSACVRHLVRARPHNCSLDDDNGDTTRLVIKSVARSQLLGDVREGPLVPV
jgi:hypothetical protein